MNEDTFARLFVYTMKILLKALVLKLVYDWFAWNCLDWPTMSYLVALGLAWVID